MKPEREETSKLNEKNRSGTSFPPWRETPVNSKRFNTVYICSPLGGNVGENLERVKRYTEYALKCGTAPVVPHFYALCLDDNKPREREIGIAAGLSLLWFCDEMWIFGETVSEGMRGEIRLCKRLYIPTRHISETEIQEKIGGTI